jgi:hypothetical protein
MRGGCIFAGTDGERLLANGETTAHWRMLQRTKLRRMLNQTFQESNAAGGKQ